MKYLSWYDKKYHDEEYYINNVRPGDKSGLYLHKEVNYLFKTLLSLEEKKIVEDYYSSKAREGDVLTYDFLHYVPFISIITGTRYCSYMGSFWSAIFEYNLERSEEIMNFIINRYAENDYDKAETYTCFAKSVYTTYEKDTNHLELVAKYGLKAFALRDFWFNIYEKEGYGLKLDFFWSTLCNVLKKLNRLDEAIEIAEFAYKNNAYDHSQGGWKARLEKLKKAKIKSL